MCVIARRAARSSTGKEMRIPKHPPGLRIKPAVKSDRIDRNAFVLWRLWATGLSIGRKHHVTLAAALGDRDRADGVCGDERGQRSVWLAGGCDRRKAADMGQAAERPEHGRFDQR